MEVDALSILLTIAIAVVFALIKFNKTEPDIHPLLLEQQASVAPIRAEGESAVYRPKSLPAGSALVKAPLERIKTLHDVWQNGLVTNPTGRCLMYMLQNQFSYVNETYEQVDRRIAGFGTGFITETKLKPRTETPVGIYAPYSQESFIAQQAFYRYGFVAVPIHDLRSSELLIEIVNQTKMKAIVVAQKALTLLLQSLKDCPSIKTIFVSTIYISEEQKRIAARHGVRVLKFAEVEYSGSWEPLDHVKPESSDVAMINYNTKSTSLSKGVVLTHGNLVAAMTGFSGSLPGAKKFTTKDRLLSHFTNGDVIGTWMTSAMVLAGGSIVFPSGLMKNVLHDSQATTPTIFASTPIILEKIHEALDTTYGAGSSFKKAYAAKLALLDAGRVTTTSLWDFIGLGEVRSRLGGKVRLVVTTNPTKAETLKYIRAAMGIHVVTTYGRTETSGIVTSRNMFDYSNDARLGAPVNCNEIKLVDDPEGRYTSADQPNPRGEILVRGPNVMKGYYKKPNATATSVDIDGWFHTGEWGSFNGNGTLEVLGKKKKVKSDKATSSPANEDKPKE
ncbi:Long-chain-fatty-acid--CoA ligase 6 [Mortierella sp. GBA35]|nr:Long-chain-fatty-acid--CoA ligase 6 [Mortierella sp. AD031]KAF9101495.1 Long-chain-fatty-acid--CoA ligase 6 [Mortierella sp. GBA35]KAG0215182.1 Long-chain-fatty-acid--CoA ligase 6 [Mortierella sp. NVP41]